MENYQMSCSGCRPYTRTCGMSSGQGRRTPMPEKQCPINVSEKRCDCVMPGTKSKDAQMYEHLQYLEPAMAYVPCQVFKTTFDLSYALSVGTIFPELCKPFCGKRGVRK